jgi:hypothetical protein
LYGSTGIFSNSRAPDRDPTHVILSVGINNREGSNVSTLSSDISRAMLHFAKFYPNSQRFVPLVNFPSHLPKAQKEKLVFINNQLREFSQRYQYMVIPALEKGFCTEPGDIHWTKDTANQILAHWCNFLN